jgi:hypothetical protein
MPIYEFKSPEGANYYGEGASPEEAFRTAEERDPATLAAMRQRQAVKPSGGRGESEFTGQLENFMIPGVSAAKSAMRGEYGQAAGEAALSAAPYGLGKLPTAAKALGAGAATLFAPSATAGGMFDSIADPKVRRSLQKQYDEASPKGKREITAQFMAQQGKAAEEQRASERETAERGETQKRRTDWMADNADAIKSLKPQWQQQIQAAGSLPEAQEMFNRGMEERKKSSMTIAEKYPEAVGGLEAAGMVGAALLPGKLAAGRSGAIKQATTDAEEAFRAAWGPGAKASKGRVADADLAENILKQAKGMGQFSGTEVAGGLAAPWIMGQMPNFYDMVVGQLSSDPGAQEKVQRAWDNVLSLGPLERALIEGGASTFLGTWLGSGRRDFGATKSRAQGVLDTFEGRRTAEAAVAEAKATKAAEMRARKVSKPTLVPPPNPLSQSDVLKSGSSASVLDVDFGGGMGH